MRWLASLVVLCLIAGTGAPRPRPEPRDPRAAHALVAADGLVPQLAARRGGPPIPDARRELLGPFAAPGEPIALAPPPACALAASAPPPAPLAPGAARLHRARGPPLG